MAPKKGNYDPFNPENSPIACPECQKDKLAPRGAYLRVCKTCGRTEVFEKPDRKVHGERPYKRLMARQKKKFGSTDGIALPQWIVKPRPEGELASQVSKEPTVDLSLLLVKRLRALRLSPEQIAGVLTTIERTCHYCWNADDDCRCRKVE